MEADKNNLQKHLSPQPSSASGGLRLAGKIWVPVLVLVALAVAYLGIASAYSVWPFSKAELQETSTSPQPSPSPGEGELAGWRTYRNEEFGFEVKYPGKFTIETNRQPSFVQVFLNIDKNDGFTIMASKDYQPGWENYFFDSTSNGEITLGDYTWKTFFLPQGYGDGPTISKSPLYGLKVVNNNIQYSTSFDNQTGISPLQIHKIGLDNKFSLS